jgi:hypothetical protein
MDIKGNTYYLRSKQSNGRAKGHDWARFGRLPQRAWEKASIERWGLSLNHEVTTGSPPTQNGASFALKRKYSTSFLYILSYSRPLCLFSDILRDGRLTTRFSIGHCFNFGRNIKK